MIDARSCGPISVHTEPRGIVVDPLGWAVHGVLAPLKPPRRLWVRPVGLICCEEGLVEFSRSMDGIFSIGVPMDDSDARTCEADTVDDLFARIRPAPCRVFERSELGGIRFHWRSYARDVYLVRHGQKSVRYGTLACNAAAMYLSILRRLYGPLVTESGSSVKTWRLGVMD